MAKGTGADQGRAQDLIGRLFVGATLAGIAAATSAAAGTDSRATSSVASIVVSAPKYENKVVCKYQSLGATRFQTRECYTNKEWDRMRDETIRLAHEMIDSPKLNPGQ